MIRGRKFLREVPMELIAEAAIGERFEQDLADEATQKAIKNEQRALIHLGILDQGSELAEDFVGAAREQVLGFYDTNLERFYIRDDIPPGELAPVIAHELTHALDDQHFDLDGLSAGARGDGDRSNALSP